MAQWVKDPVLSLLWLCLQLCHGFDPWPRNFYMILVQQKKKKNKQKPNRKEAYHHHIVILFSSEALVGIWTQH